MKKNQFQKEFEAMLFRAGIGWEKRETRLQVLEKFEGRISGKRGAEDARDRFYKNLKRLYPPVQRTYFRNHASRLQTWKRKMAETLSKKAGANYDEHGYARGDYRTTYGLDYVGPWESAKAPYWDMGGEGLGLVRVDRKRIYAKSSKWRPSSVSTYFLVAATAGHILAIQLGQIAGPSRMPCNGYGEIRHTTLSSGRGILPLSGEKAVRRCRLCPGDTRYMEIGSYTNPIPIYQCPKIRANESSSAGGLRKEPSRPQETDLWR